MRILGYTVKDACCALEISRSGYYGWGFKREAERDPGARDQDLLERIKTLKTEHPFWGYRRVRAWLVHRDGLGINEKRVRRVMKENALMATQTVHKAKRTPQRSKPKAERPRQYWGIDMTKFMIPALGWIYLVIPPIKADNKLFHMYNPSGSDISSQTLMCSLPRPQSC